MRKRTNCIFNSLLNRFKYVKQKMPVKQVTNDHYSAKHTEICLPMKRIWQRSEGIARPNSACGPAVATTLINYLTETGFIENELQNEAAQVNMFYKKIGTTIVGTSAKRWCKAVQSYLNERADHGNWIVKQHPAMGRFLSYCHAIDNGYPVVLRFTFNFSKDAFASHHYVIGVGYKINGERKKIATIDPDGGEWNTGVHWIDWDVNERYMKLITVYHRNKQAQ